MPETRRDVNAAASKSSWYQVYFAALLESDQQRVLSKIELAQKAIQDRSAELRAAATVDEREIQDLRNAMTYLCILLQYVGSESAKMLWD